MPHLRTEIGPTPPVAASGAAPNSGSPARRVSCPLAALAAAASTEHTKQTQDVPSKASSTATSKLNGSGGKASILQQGMANKSPVLSPSVNKKGNKKKADVQPHPPAYPPPHGYPHQPPPPGYGWGPYPPPGPRMPMQGPPPSSKTKESASEQVQPTPPPHHYPYYYYHPYPPPHPHMMNGQPPHLPLIEARKVTVEDTMRPRQSEEEKKDDSDDDKMPSALTAKGVKKEILPLSSKEDRRLSKEEYFDDIVKRNLERRKSPGSSEKEEKTGEEKPTSANRVVSPHTSDAPSSNDNSPVPISSKSSHKAAAPHANHAGVPPPPPHYPPYHHYYPYPPPMSPPGSANHLPAHAYYPRHYGTGPPSSPPQSPPSSSQIKNHSGATQVPKKSGRTPAATIAAPAAPKQDVKNPTRSGKNEAKAKPPKVVEKVIAKEKITTDPTQKDTNLSTNTHDRCVPLLPPIPSHFYGDIETEKNVEIPDFHQIINYPEYFIKSRSRSSTPVPGTPSMPKSGLHNCVMCAEKRPATPETISVAMSEAPNKKNPPPVIPTQNKGLCTACDVVVWVIQATGKNIKWCKGCKNFRNWAAFGEKGSATKCEKCRTRQRAKYLEQRDELKEKRKSLSTGGDANDGKMNSTKKRRVDKTPGELILQTAKSEDEALNAAIGLSQLFSSPTHK